MLSSPYLSKLMFKTPLSIDILPSSVIGIGEVEEADVGGINCGVEVRFGVVGDCGIEIVVETNDLLLDIFRFVGLELEGTNAKLA